MKKFTFVVEVSSGLDDKPETIKKDIQDAFESYGLQGRVLGLAAIREEKEGE